MAPGEPGPVLGNGRAATVYDVGAGRVLRRDRTAVDAGGTPRDLTVEAEAMRWVRAHGVPTPEVFDVDGADLVMERIEGRSLLHGIGTSPHRLPAAGRILANLHRRLDAVPAAGVLPCRYPPDARTDVALGVIHGDLHPDNVIMSPSGPVLIDWTNACAGDRGADLAQTWIILEHLGRSERRIAQAAEDGARRVLLRAFLRRVDRARAAAWLERVATARLDDPNTSERERERLRRRVLSGR
jgi:aminoglycoside phosphotransferase (APT) family kinase protein